MDASKVGALDAIKSLGAANRRKEKLIRRIEESMRFIERVVAHERGRLKGSGLDGHLNAIGGTVLEVRRWISEHKFGVPDGAQSQFDGEEAEIAGEEHPEEGAP